MLSEARNFMELDPWLAVAPGTAITIAVLGFNLFGDGLRDALDPRLRGLG
jgi:ABC-type dipeptide/oligopeptide/nickel transport system permease subunit